MAQTSAAEQNSPSLEFLNVGQMMKFLASVVKELSSKTLFSKIHYSLVDIVQLPMKLTLPLASAKFYDYKPPKTASHPCVRELYKEKNN